MLTFEHFGGMFSVHTLADVIDKKCLFPVKYRENLLFWGEYQIYFVECVENNRNFTSA